MACLTRAALACAAVLLVGCFAEFPPPAESRRTPDAQRPDVDVVVLDGVAPDQMARPDTEAVDAQIADITLDGPRDAFRLSDVPEPDAELPDAAPCAPTDEVCNGQDDDCNGLIDEDQVCDLYIPQHCVVGLGYSSEPSPAEPVEMWGGCPPRDRANSGTDPCVMTRHTARFQSIRIRVATAAGHRVGLRFACEDEENAELAAWLQAHCRVYLGYSGANGGPDDVPAWGACPLSGSGEGDLPCTSTGGDGLWHDLVLPDALDQQSDFGLAFICDDPTQAERAAAVSRSVDVFLGYSRSANTDGHDSAAWDICPAAPQDDNGPTRCTSTQGDLNFHRLDIGVPVNGVNVHALSVALLPR